MRRSSRSRRSRRHNPTLGTGTTLAVLGVVALGGTLLYASMASASPAAPAPRRDPTPPPPAPAENPTDTAAQPAVTADPTDTNERAPATTAPAPEPVDNPVHTDASGAEQRVFPDHVVAILGADTVVRSSAVAGSPIVARLRTGQRVNVRADNGTATARRRCGTTSGIVSVYGIAVAGGRTVDGYACINAQELPAGSSVRIDGVYTAGGPFITG